MDLLKKIIRRLPSFFLLITFLFLVFNTTVSGQTLTTRLLINPTPLLIDTTISPTGVVNLEVVNGTDVFAFDLFVEYDAALLHVSQVSLGDFLGEGLFCMDMVNNPGLVTYECPSFGVDTVNSCSRELLKQTKKALGPGGDTLLSLGDSQLYESQDAFALDPILDDGAVSVRPYWTYLPLILTASEQAKEAGR